jgi:hypothetical protein
MKQEKPISVLLPSRNRFEMLQECISNLIQTSADTNNFEILIRFDSDDVGSLSKIGDLPYDEVDISVIVGNRFEGYADLHIYVNELCSIARGTFLFLYNDDSTIKTQGWDALIKQERKVVALNPRALIDGKYKYNLFPIVHRKIYDTLGYFSLSPHNDSWMFEITKTMGIEKKFPMMIIDHFRSDLQDETTKERVESLQVSVKRHRKAIEDECLMAAVQKSLRSLRC